LLIVRDRHLIRDGVDCDEGRLICDWNECRGVGWPIMTVRLPAMSS
jgi:hypothetical protein